MLDRLKAAGCRLAVLTNKESQFAHRVLAGHDLTDAFEVIVAGDTLKVRKPDPAVVHHALQALDATPDEAVLIGDSVLDVRCARAAGIRVWTVRHGYPAGVLTGEDRPDALIDHFDQIGLFGQGGPGHASASAPMVTDAANGSAVDLPRRVVIA
jgi:phosphoglycolate phosphatase